MTKERKGPSESATQFSIGTKKLGNNGNMWEIIKTKKVDLRNVWKHEAIDFTNGLAKEENLELLSDEIGIDSFS